MSDDNSDEVTIAKQYLWNLFIQQFLIGWTNRFPRRSAIADYIEPEKLEWLEAVGKKAAEDNYKKRVNQGST